MLHQSFLEQARRALLIALLLLLLATPALGALARPSSAAHAEQQSQGRVGALDGDLELLVPLFNKSAIIDRIGVVYRLENGVDVPIILTKYIVGSSKSLKAFALNGTSLAGTYYNYYIHAIVSFGKYNSIILPYYLDVIYRFYSSTLRFVSSDLNRYPSFEPCKLPNGTLFILMTQHYDSQYISIYRGLAYIGNIDLGHIFDTISGATPAQPAGCNGSHIMIVRHDRYNSDNHVYVYLIDLRNLALASSASYALSDPVAAYYATAAYTVYGVRRAAVKIPWYVGFDSSGHILTYNADEGSFHLFNISSYGMGSITYLELVDYGGEEAALLLGLSSSDSSTPIVAIVDPATGEVLDNLTLEGFPTGYLRGWLGFYAGYRVLYVATQGYLLAVSIEGGLQLVGALETAIAYPYAVHYAEAPDGGMAVLVVSGLKSDGSTLFSQVYAVGGVAQLSRVTLDAPSSVYAGEPFTVNVTLKTITGEPIAGQPVNIERLTSEGWQVVASYTTDENGTAQGTLVLPFNTRGPVLLRASYPGGSGEGGNYTPAYSRPVTVDSYLRVNVTLSLSSSATVEGVPVSAIVDVHRAVDGAPVEGVWLRVEYNLTTNLWPSAGAGVTNSQGRAVIPVNLNRGVYTLRVAVTSPYIEVSSSNTVVLYVFSPAEPPPEGPYPSPVGRVIAFAPPMAEVGSEAVVAFAFYYGESLVAPEDYSVVVEPSGTSYTVEELQPGFYLVHLTPGSTGLYTVVFTVTLNYAQYVGVASFYAYDVESRLEAWEAQIDEVLSGLQALNSTLTSYLESINQSLASLNMTELYTVLLEVRGNTAQLLAYAGGLNESMANLTQAQQAVLQALEGINQSLDTLSGLVISNWQAIEGLNETVIRIAGQLNASLDEVKVLVGNNGQLIISLNASLNSLRNYLAGRLDRLETLLGQLNASLDEVRVLVNSNGQLLVAVNASLSGRLQSLGDALAGVNASLTGVVGDAEGRLLAVINSSAGLIIAGLDDLKYNITLSLEGASQNLSTLLRQATLTIETSIGSLNVTLEEAMNELGIVKGLIISANQTITGLQRDTLLTIRLSNGTIVDMLASQLKPGIEALAGRLALVNTTLGLVAADLESILGKANTAIASIESLASTAGESLTSISEKLDEISSKIDALQQRLQQAPTQEDVDQAARQASQAKTYALAGIGTGTAGLLAAIANILRRP